jgi:hypothetical protein
VDWHRRRRHIRRWPFLGVLAQEAREEVVDFAHEVLPYVNLVLILLTLILVVRHNRNHHGG